MRVRSSMRSSSSRMRWACASSPKASRTSGSSNFSPRWAATRCRVSCSPSRCRRARCCCGRWTTAHRRNPSASRCSATPGRSRGRAGHEPLPLCARARAKRRASACGRRANGSAPGSVAARGSCIWFDRQRRRSAVPLQTDGPGPGHGRLNAQGESTMSDILSPFPAIEIAPERRQWPTPPFAWRHVPPPDNDVVQACSIELSWGTTADGEMLDFNPTAAYLRFRLKAKSSDITLPFSRLRRLVLKDPLVPAPKMAGAPVERVPFAAQEREYRLQAKDGKPIVGRTAGYVANNAGLYLFTPLDDDRTLQRVFVPRCAYTACEFGQ